MYAIIENGGKQYKVSEGDVVRVEKLKAEVGDSVEFKAVMISDESGVKTGEEVANAKFPPLWKHRISSKRSSFSSINRKRTSAKNRAIASPSPK